MIAAAKSGVRTEPKTFELDISSNIYISTRTKKYNQVFRVSTVLKQDIRPEIMAQAITDLKERFPTFYVQLKTGFFRYRLVEADDTDVLVPESDYPCKPVAVGSGQKPMFRVLYIRNRVSLEVFHALTDGGGALSFLKNIVARYLTLLGHQFEYTNGVVDCGEAPKDFELEDSIKQLYQKDLGRISRKEPSAYQYKPQFKKNYINVIHGLLRVDELKQLTKAKGVTITAYLTAVYIYAFYLDYLPNISNKEIRISVPCEVRRMFNLQTLRNCSLYANIGFLADRNDYTFDEILAQTVTQLEDGVSKEKLQRIITTSIDDFNLPVFRFSPVFLKNFLIKAAVGLFGSRLVTTSFSNFGIVTVPNGMEEFIDHFEFMLSSTAEKIINCGTVTFGNIINITFTCASENTNIQRLFFKFLSEQGVNIRIQSNTQNDDVLEENSCVV